MKKGELKEKHALLRIHAQNSPKKTTGRY